MRDQMDASPHAHFHPHPPEAGSVGRSMRESCAVGRKKVGVVGAVVCEEEGERCERMRPGI